MIGIVITGHGEFATGIHSAIELVAGVQEALKLVNFSKDDSSEMLSENLKKAIKDLNTKETIVFTDIPGGTPFKESARISAENEGIKVISGTNIPMLLEILFDRKEGNIDKVIARATNTGKEQIISFEVESEEDDFEDGI